MTVDQPAVEIIGLSKTFPGQRAVSDVSFDIAHGEVHGLLGENGSGKSTLIKILSGFHEPDPGGEVRVGGVPLEFGSSVAAAARGLRFVHQNLGIIPEMTAIENFALSGGAHALRRIRRDRERERTRRLFERFGVDVPVTIPLGRCRPVDRTVVAIVRALDTLADNGVLVLDEPTAALPAHEVAHLFDVVRDLRRRGISTIYVSHRLDEVFAICDRVSVLRDGVLQGTRPIGELSRADLVSMITGSASSPTHTVSGNQVRPEPSGSQRPSEVDTPRLHVRGLRAGAISEATFDVARGEIVGIAGITGSGREEIASALVGAISSNAQELRVDGVDVPTPLRPRSALAAGVALVPGNRGAGSAIGDFDIRENLSLPTLAQVARRGRISRRAETALAMHWIGQLDIRPRRPTRKLAALSGGNQQKVILAKWFNADPKVIVLDDPTSGVDVGARQSIYRLIRDRAAQGTAVIVASSDDEDLLSLCSRVLVMRAGRIGAELTGDEITAHALLMAHAEEASPRVDAATTTTDHGATA